MRRDVETGLDIDARSEEWARGQLGDSPGKIQRIEDVPLLEEAGQEHISRIRRLPRFTRVGFYGPGHLPAPSPVAQRRTSPVRHTLGGW